jgi:beta-glucan synthesis-associated protein KRE6
MLGNLARATYVGSADYIWPFSYNKCNERTRQSQEINACANVNHFGMAAHQGRGSPEIDVLESMQGSDERLPNTWVKRPYQSASLQVAPGVEVDRPALGHRPHKVRFVYTRLRAMFAVSAHSFVCIMLGELVYEC